MTENVTTPIIAGCSSFKKIDKDIRNCERQIRNLEKKIRRLKGHRNTIAPVSTLPPEILSAIFLSLHGIFQKWGCPWGWIIITAVCRTWRKIAFKDSRLWTVLDMENPMWCKKAVALSKSRLLSVNYVYQPDDSDYSDDGSDVDVEINDVFSHLSRFRTLTMHSPQRSLLNGISTYFGWGCSNLVSLNIEKPGKKLPSKMFEIAGPHLKSLELKQCIFDWDALCSMKALTTLHICSPSEAPKRSELVAVFQSTTQLQELRFTELSHLGPSQSSNRSDILQRVTLPRLERLYVQNKHSKLRPQLSLFSMMNIPENAYANFLFRPIYEPKAVDSWQDLNELANTLVSMRESFPITYFKVSTTPSLVEVKCGSSIIGEEEEGEGDTTILLNLRLMPVFEHLTHPADIPPHLYRFWSHSLWLNEFILRIDPKTSCSSGLFASLETCPNLCILTLSNAAASYFSQYLLEKQNQAGFAIGFSMLRILSIRDSDMDKVDMNVFYSFLEARRKENIGLDELSLNYCKNVPADAAEKLELLVEELFWDSDEDD